VKLRCKEKPAPSLPFATRMGRELVLPRQFLEMARRYPYYLARLLGLEKWL